MHRKELSYYLTSFFTEYLGNEAGLSINTIKSYRDAFILFFKYLEEAGIFKINKLKMDTLNVDNVNRFLDWLEQSRGCSISSRNQRLAALKAFCSYVARKSPEESNLCQGVFKIRIKKAPQKPVEYLCVDAVEYLIKMPDSHSTQGIRDLAMIALMYESGCRVQELIDLSVGDIAFRSPNTVTLTGKGKKVRVIPISTNAADIIKAYLNSAGISDVAHSVFVNRYDKPLSRSGVSYVLDKYGHIARKARPELYPPKLHPHVLRHSKAMHLLENGVNLIYIRDFLGHSSVTTTEIYARCNPELKRKYIEQAGSLITESVEEYSESEKEALIAWLRKNI
ncbi:Tyrosine recombinase XerC [Sporotomaculum syntrophicum]|uniref:Tyrosine recombinase XerC n=1 Tax=Sporotomaculum syntrophicum TaxID=182264 RepID=A0A9D2WSX0_9FIRM|nr:tyrosine-type recombinase/integrase [Sporotomaculum syntrophicum]KAF1086316.1 Tyrosine recombinase XerC [Sporotomaculum syntrophicum]